MGGEAREGDWLMGRRTGRCWRTNPVVMERRDGEAREVSWVAAQTAEVTSVRAQSVAARWVKPLSAASEGGSRQSDGLALTSSHVSAGHL